MIGMRATSGSVGDQVQERGHGLLAVEQVGVHVDVEQVGPAAHLLERDVDGALVVAGFDQPPEPRRAGDVGALADHDEAGVGAEIERLQAAEPGASGGQPESGAAAARPRRPAICAMCAGVVPQQPPTMLTIPEVANSPSSPAVCSGVWS